MKARFLADIARWEHIRNRRGSIFESLLAKLVEFLIILTFKLCDPVHQELLELCLLHFQVSGHWIVTYLHYFLIFTDERYLTLQTACLLLLLFNLDIVFALFNGLIIGYLVLMKIPIAGLGPWNARFLLSISIKFIDLFLLQEHLLHLSQFVSNGLLSACQLLTHYR